MSFYTSYMLPLLLLGPVGSNSALQLHKLLSRVFLCNFCHYILVSPYCTVPTFSPPQLLISHCQKSWSPVPWCVHSLGTADDWWPCGCFAARAWKQVCSSVFHCHRQQLKSHRTARKMKHVAFGKTLRWNNRPCDRFYLKQNFSPQRYKQPLRFQPLVRASPY